LAFAAVLAGFLIYNSNPASIFMGDCGSMFIGFFLASMALVSASGGRSRTVLPVLAVPVLVLLIPIFDITIVTVLRKLAGRPVSRGGRDHTSHRLVALGLSERRAVLMLYVLAAASGALALLVRDASLEFSLTAILGFTVALTLLGVYLSRVKIYSEEELTAARSRPIVAFLFELSHRRRIFEVLLDMVLVILSYALAWQLIYGPLETAAAWEAMLVALPVLIATKLATFLVFGVYRGLWQYVSIENLVVYARAVLAATIVSAATLLVLFRFEGFSRAVLVVDGLLLLVLICGSRAAFRLFRNLVHGSPPVPANRVLIYGAGDAGELLVRILRNNQKLAYQPIGFLDDDPLKKGKRIHGLRVYGGNGSMLTICREHGVQEILIAGSKFTDDRTRQILDECQRADVAVKRMRMQLESLS
jgi:UDP-GlcNAc:undecaprenyl-phosphate GlcNAc-1-phosphate transferase